MTFEDLHENLHLMGRPLLNDEYYAEGLDLDGPGAVSRTTPLLFYRLTGYDLVLLSTSDLNEVPANVIIAAASQRLPLDITGMKGNVTAEFTAGIDSCLREFPVTDTHSAMQFIKKQVSHHMRTIHSIETVEGEIQTGVLSEPLLRYVCAHTRRGKRSDPAIFT